MIKNLPEGPTKKVICPGTSPKRLIPAGKNVLGNNDKKDDIGSGYIGGKGGSGVYQTIINLMPLHDVYIETHLGGASIMKKKRPAWYNIGIDLDKNVVDYWSSSPLFKNGGNSSSKKIASTTTKNDVLPRGIRINNSENNGYRTIIDINDDTVPDFEFINMDAVLYLMNYKFTGNEFIYCDPPYLLSTRKNRKYYKHEYIDQDHRRLLKFLKTLPCSIMISGYYSDLYMKMLPGWNTKNYEAQTRGGKTATEWLWFNYPVPEVLHDYSYLGDTFRERERIKKKRDRWTARLKKMPAAERNGILKAFRELEK